MEAKVSADLASWLPTPEVGSASQAVANSQRDRAYEALRCRLLLQEIPEGERLREPEWSRRLGVNRVALRESFARLEAQGFLQKGPKTGYFVPVLTKEDIQEIAEVRAALECAAVARICSGGAPGPETVAPLFQCCDEFEVLIRIGYLAPTLEADRRFHEALVNLSGNRHLSKFYGNAPLLMLHGDDWEEWRSRVLIDHRAIASAIENGDGSRAQTLLKMHLCGPGLANLIARLDATPAVSRATGRAKVLREAGLDAPDDISIAGFDDTKISEDVPP